MSTTRMRAKQCRKLPLLSEALFAPLTLLTAVLHIVFSPLGLVPVVSMLLTGGLFGLFLIPTTVAALALFLVESIWPVTSILVLKLVGIPFVLCYVVRVLILDRSDVNVEHAVPTVPRNAIEEASKKFWSSCLDYFPMTCIPWSEDASLPPSRQYIFGVHPHGIHCLQMGMFTSEGSSFDLAFPGLVGNTLTGLVASVLFRLPIVRELFLHMGYVDASRKVANEALLVGRSLFVCVGGEEEALLTTVGDDAVVLSRRKGFIRLALSHGADLVPVFAAGVTDLYKTHGFLGKERRWLQKKFGIAVPIFHGRCWSPLPFKIPLQVFVGKPIPTPQPKRRGDRPDEKLVDAYHAKYIAALKKLHCTNVKDRKLRVL